MDKIRNIFSSQFDGGKASLQECGLSRDQRARTLDQLLTRTEQELHVFPFSTVQKCWLNLYTDVRLLRAQDLLESLRYNVSFTSDTDKKVLSEVIAELDYALIVAGGGNEARRSLVHEILVALADALERDMATSTTQTDDRPAKRRRLSTDCRGRRLPCGLSPLPVIGSPLTRLIRPNLQSFEAWAGKNREPAVLTQTLEHWPALENWKNPDYWLEQTLGGRRLVPVEIGQSYHDEGWRQQIMPFHEFLSQCILNADNPGTEVGYLAQHDLFGQIDGLRRDFMIPDFCYSEMPDDGNQNDCNDALDQSEPEIHQNIWFGGRTVSPLHHDPYHNVLCQVHGTKYIKLYSPEHTDKLYPKSRTEPAPHTAGESEAAITSTDEPTLINGKEVDKGKRETIDMSNNSSVDVFAMESSPHEDWNEKWPGISEVPYVECILHAGETLYIPKGWWHYVRGLSSCGISVSFWW